MTKFACRMALLAVLGIIVVSSADAQNTVDPITKKLKEAAGKDDLKPGIFFEVYKDAGGHFRFRIKDGEGAIVASSVKSYQTKAECTKAIEAIRSDAGKAKVIDEPKTEEPKKGDSKK